MQTNFSRHPDVSRHIPPERFVDFDFYNVPRQENGRDLDLRSKRKAVQDRLPRLSLTPDYGGHWVATRYSEIGHFFMNKERLFHVCAEVACKSE